MAGDERFGADEAVAAGRRALESLGRAADALESASNWGAFDLFLGGALTSLVKHARLRGAREELEAARDDLYAFTREVRDASDIEVLRMDVGALTTTLDVLFDNPLVDLYVQSKIDDARDNVDAAIRATRAVLARLEGAR